MNYYDVKFSLNFDKYDYSKIKYIFNNARSALNWQFDENFNAKLIDEDINYQIRDVSNLERNENIINTDIYSNLKTTLK